MHFKNRVSQCMSIIIIGSSVCKHHCCDNYRSEVIDYNYDYFSLRMPNCNFNHYLHLKVTITTKKGQNYRYKKVKFMLISFSIVLPEN